jgi:capsular polysaccharide export protein
MRNVLIYIEPHPVRNYFEEFYDVGMLLCDGMHQLERERNYDFRFFSNDAVIDRLVIERAHLSYLSLRFTADENERLENLYGQWNLKTIHEWLSLVQGKGPITEFYLSVLERLHKEYPFEAIILWSDNGAVREFCRAHSIAVMHAEYGPTRSPLHQTIYLDPLGTNGAASVLKAPLSAINPKIIVPRETWVTRQGKAWNDENKLGLIDAPLTVESELITAGYSDNPYIFIPLQLEDDLNTQLYSEFKTPESFLRHVIPQALDAGLNVVIKGHPAAQGRTFNLIAETKALKYARSFDDRVKILPRNASAFHSMNVIAQSVAVITINSSVGFEALLLGKNTVLYGAAAFDVGGKLFAGDKLMNQKDLTAENDSLDHLTSFLCGHYLHPIEAVTKGPGLAIVLDYIIETKGKDHTTVEYWESWIKAIDFGYSWLAETLDDRSFSRLGRSVGKIAGNRKIFESNGRRYSIAQRQLMVTGTLDNELITASATIIENSFIGFIDTLFLDDGVDGKYLEITGWSLDCHGYRPPIQILFCVGPLIISLHRVLTPRPDVAEVFRKKIANRCGFTFQVEKKHFIEPADCSLIFLSPSNFAHIAPLRLGDIATPSEASEHRAIGERS